MFRDADSDCFGGIHIRELLTQTILGSHPYCVGSSQGFETRPNFCPCSIILVLVQGLDLFTQKSPSVRAWQETALFSLIVCCRCHTAVLATQNMFCCPFGPHADSLFRLKVCHSPPHTHTHTMFEFVGDSLGQALMQLVTQCQLGRF